MRFTHSDSRPMDAAAAASGAAEPSGGIFGRRRRLVVNRSYQFRVSFLAVAVVLALLLLLNLSLYSFAQVGNSAVLDAAPELRDLLRAQDRVQLNLTLLGSLVFLVGVFLVTLLESHKTAGAAYHVGRCLDRLREGRLTTRVRLRKGDNLRELEAAVNALAASLEEAARRDAELLDRLAEQAEPAGADAVAHGVAAELRRLAAGRRRSAEA